MNKKEAAQFLGLSVKSLERYTTQKRIAVRYIKGTHGKEADYSQEDLERLKAEIDNNSLPDVSPALVEEPTALAIPNAPKPTLPTILNGENGKELFDILRNIADGLTSRDKLLLTVKDVAIICSLSFSMVTKFIKEGKLRGVKVGRGWRVRREDLEAWVKGL